jgi:hypothetical protein
MKNAREKKSEEKIRPSIFDFYYAKNFNFPAAPTLALKIMLSLRLRLAHGIQSLVCATATPSF